MAAIEGSQANGTGEITKSEPENECSHVDSDHEVQEKLEAAKQLADRYEKLLQEERTYRQELEKIFESKSKDAEDRTSQLTDKLQALEKRLLTMERVFEDRVQQVHEKFNSLSTLHRQQRQNFDQLSDRYQKLAGHYRKTANQLREEDISLPQNVSELQFECLKLREELIEARALKEHSEEEHASELEALHSELEQTRSLPRLDMERSSPDNEELKQNLDELEKRLGESQAESSALARSLEEYRQRCAQLQVELDTSETVQKDFVRLSQNLQIQLEKIRQAEQEVRWQFHEDAYKCNGCECNLKRLSKANCMHCGKVFCGPCVNNPISTGPSNRQAKVCSVCHTLLNRNSAPFFSKITPKQ